VSNANTLKFRLGTKRIGGRVKFTVLRDGKQKNLYLNLISAPETPARDIRLLKGEHPFAGAEVANLSPALAEELGIDTFAKGVIVTRIRTGSLAAQVRLRPGDIFLTVEDQEIDSSETLQRVMSQPLEQWRVSIRRGKKNISVVLGE
jgi:serine protease Do